MLLPFFKSSSPSLIACRRVFLLKIANVSFHDSNSDAAKITAAEYFLSLKGEKYSQYDDNERHL